MAKGCLTDEAGLSGKRGNTGNVSEWAGSQPSATEESGLGFTLCRRLSFPISSYIFKQTQPL